MYTRTTRRSNYNTQMHINYNDSKHSLSLEKAEIDKYVILCPNTGIARV